MGGSVSAPTVREIRAYARQRGARIVAVVDGCAIVSGSKALGSPYRLITPGTPTRRVLEALQRLRGDEYVPQERVKAWVTVDGERIIAA